MATAHQIKSLLKSYSRGDDESFLTVALQIAANEAGKGHSAFAQEIKKFVMRCSSALNQIIPKLTFIRRYVWQLKQPCQSRFDSNGCSIHDAPVFPLARGAESA
jgi:hypothetical protein